MQRLPSRHPKLPILRLGIFFGPLLGLICSVANAAETAPQTAFEKAVALLETTAEALRAHHPERDPRVPTMSPTELEKFRQSLYGKYMQGDVTAPPIGTPVSGWDNFYNFDALRDPATSLSQGLGGACNTHARALAHRALGAGVAAQDVRIVSTVLAQDLARLCPKKGGHYARTNSGLSGHVFLLLADGEGHWRLLDSSFQPKFAQGASAPFLSPTELDAALAQGSKIAVPKEALAGMPEFLRDLVVFHSTLPGDYKEHSFVQRPAFIASGDINSGLCRFSR